MGNKGGVEYPSDVSDEEWAYAARYLTLCREDAGQREYPLRAVFNAVRYVARTGGQWRYLPNDLPPWYVVYYQMQRWLRAGCFETMVEDLRSLLREFAGRTAQPTAMILNSRTLQSTPESGAHGGYDGTKRRPSSRRRLWPKRALPCQRPVESSRSGNRLRYGVYGSFALSGRSPQTKSI
jgi:transposase